MIIAPRIRGFICTTAHPAGCAANVHEQVGLVRSQAPLSSNARNVLVVGASGGYGLASRIAAAFGGGAATLGVSFERQPTATRTATAGWYNNIAFEEAAKAQGLYATTLDGDAFSDEMKGTVTERIRSDMGEIDLLIYSLASPVRQHPRNGQRYRSSIKPLGETVHIKTVNVEKGDVHEVDLAPASEEEAASTVAVMGGEDWEMWVDALAEAGLMAKGFRTVSYNYLGSELTWPIYRNGTLGRAKEDLDRAAKALMARLANLPGEARVVTLKAIVSQASSAIPVVPLYTSLLFRVMKDAKVHEEIIEHIHRLFATQLADGARMNLDEQGRIRMDDWELADDIQEEVRRRWSLVTSENLAQLGDLEGVRADFLKIFGFGLDGVDYSTDQDPALGRMV
jgi:enoyl-[acyl-carrier protein] reductase/trans-2-enoyl-CoA reductase (NAD+)